MKKNQNKMEYDATEKEEFLAFVKEKDPEAYQLALEKGWLDSILEDIGVGHKKPAQPNTTTN